MAIVSSGANRKVSKVSTSTPVTSVSSTSTTGAEVGLNTEKITAMQTALDAYIDDAIKQVTIGASVKLIETAIQGSNATSQAKKYIKEIDTACEKYFKDLKKHRTTLDNMKQQYIKIDANTKLV